MSDTIEHAAAREALITIVTDPDDLADLDVDQPCLAIDNLCSHAYLVSGTPAEIVDFCTRLLDAALTLASN